MSSASSISTGKHMICDLTNVRNMMRLESMESMHVLLNNICERYDFTVLGKIEHTFEPQGLSVVYMLSESHISIHTFPERRYLALDIYTCRHYDDDEVYMDIYRTLVKWFQCDSGVPTILDRGTTQKKCVLNKAALYFDN
jgi:S-adenosylmethionine decarboxylase proenzyme